MALTVKATLSVLTALFFAAPAAAEWFANGNFEPDNPYDSSEWMFQDPPGIGESKVYFFVTTSSQYTTSNGKPAVNPNVGLLHTQIEPAGSERHTAHLGVWKDCNGDGYIGMAETAVREYSAQLLTTTTACPPVVGPTVTWAAGAHNYNGWVSEFVAILGDADGSSSWQNVDARLYRDDDVRIWGDFHRPDEKPFHRSCTLRPFARGTLHDTGGFLNYIDCRQPILENFNNVVDLIGDPLGLRFPDEDDARTGSLGQHDIGGDESNDNAAVRTADCDEEPTLRVHSGDTANQTPLGPSVPAGLQNTSRTIYALSPGTGDLSSPTAAGQVNQTVEEWNGDCDFENDFGHDLYNIFETDFNGVNPDNKTEADWNFGFATVTRGITGAAPGISGPAGAPADAGVGWGGTRWLADSTWLSKTGPRSVRVDLESGGVAIAPAYWLSFYAQLGQTTLDRGFTLPSGTTGTYGSWHCGGNDSGIHNGWNCDADVWYINPDGTFPSDSFGELAKPGWTYHLRDVDCYDGRIGEAGIGATPAFYGEEPCP